MPLQTSTSSVTASRPRCTMSFPLLQSRGSICIRERWSIDLVGFARSGFPFNARMFVVSPVLGFTYIRPDLVSGQAKWIPNADAGGGQTLNPAAFVQPPAGQQGNEGRNDIRVFGLTQFDFLAGKEVRSFGATPLQFRADAFNILNHPNFTNPQALVSLGLHSNGPRRC